VSGTRVIVVFAAVVFATAIVPPMTAWTVNQRRIERARSDENTLAGRVSILSAGTRRAMPAADVLFGPGRLPAATPTATAAWLTAPRGSLAAVLEEPMLPADPWGNAYLLRVQPAGGGIVLSAGPNGTIETPLSGSRRTPVGDDIVANIPALASRQR